MKYKVGILLFENVEVLDFAGPFEVFAVTSELNDHELFEVFTVAVSDDIISCVNGLLVKPQYTLDNHPGIDVLIIPGGFGTRALLTDDTVLKWVSKVHENTAVTMSVCTGSLMLGKLGLLDGTRATTHHEVFDLFKKTSPKAILSTDRFTENGKVYTSGGISAGIDLSFHIVTKLFGQTTADKTQVYMEYGNWEDKLEMVQ